MILAFLTTFLTILVIIFLFCLLFVYYFLIGLKFLGFGLEFESKKHFLLSLIPFMYWGKCLYESFKELK
jgi:hypothetical protein